ncbi:MAG: hypothetical protein PHN18_10450 [Sulfurospirillaceae bacterium]|nr:hypothetical protein [Sulfurospirillaceae bacterium]MDD2827440.1 hypothetical protein [Sulfurospirillaceae bacterium]
MKISKHASKRIKERVGLPKRAHLRHVQTVLEYGEFVTNKTLDGFKMMHNGFLYIFANLRNEEPILVTAYEPNNSLTIPSDFESKKK